MSTLTPVLIAGTVGSARQNHQADMWVPALTAAGLTAVGVWSPPSVGEEQLRTAAELATSLGLTATVSEQPELGTARGIIACLRGGERQALLSFAAERGIPVLLDKPTLDTSEEIEAAISGAPGLVVLPGHHLSAHPSFLRAIAGAHAAEIGLLRAAAVDLVVGGGDGPAPQGELRNLGVYTVDMLRQATGRATVSVQAHRSPAAAGSGESWSFLGQSDRDVVVSSHLSRTTGAGGILLAKVRLVGTHGWVLVDLLSPALEVSTPEGLRRVSYGENTVVALLSRFAAIIAGTARTAPANDILTLSHALDGITASADTQTTTTITW